MFPNWEELTIWPSVFLGKGGRAVASFSQGRTRLELSAPAPWMATRPTHLPPLGHLRTAVGGGIDLHTLVGHLNVSTVSCRLARPGLSARAWECQ